MRTIGTLPKNHALTLSATIVLFIQTGRRTVQILEGCSRVLSVACIGDAVAECDKF